MSSAAKGALKLSRIFSTSPCHSARERVAWSSTMPAEWQIRQSLLMAAASAPPGKVPSLLGKLTLTECKVTPPPATIDATGATGRASSARAGWVIHRAGVTIARRIRPTALTAPRAMAEMAMDFPPRCFRRSSHPELNALDHVAHEAAAVPVRLGRLDIALRIGTAHLQDQRSGWGCRDLGAPLAKTVGPLVAAQGGLLPTLSAVGRKFHLSHAAIAAERNPSDRHGRSGLDGRRVGDVGEKGARHQPADRH